jgi:hypothetical protein
VSEEGDVAATGPAACFPGVVDATGPATAGAPPVVSGLDSLGGNLACSSVELEIGDRGAAAEEGSLGIGGRGAAAEEGSLGIGGRGAAAEERSLGIGGRGAAAGEGALGKGGGGAAAEEGAPVTGEGPATAATAGAPPVLSGLGSLFRNEKKLAFFLVELGTGGGGADAKDGTPVVLGPHFLPYAE